MGGPCESKPEIDKIAAGQTEMEMRLRIQSEHIAQIKDASQSMVEGFREFSAEMRQQVTDIKERQITDHAETKQLRKEVEILFQDKRDLHTKILPQITETINKSSNAMTVRLEECAEKQIVPLKQRVKALEDNHLVEGGKREGWIESLKTAKMIYPIILSVGLAIAHAWRSIGNNLTGNN